MSDERKKEEEQVEAERIEDALAGEHDPDLDVEVPDYLRDFEESLGTPRPVARGG